MCLPNGQVAESAHACLIWQRLDSQTVWSYGPSSPILAPCISTNVTASCPSRRRTAAETRNAPRISDSDGRHLDEDRPRSAHRLIGRGGQGDQLPRCRAHGPEPKAMAEREGFEPPVACATAVFKTAALSRTRPSLRQKAYSKRSFRLDPAPVAVSLRSPRRHGSLCALER